MSRTRLPRWDPRAHRRDFTDYRYDDDLVDDSDPFEGIVGAGVDDGSDSYSDPLLDRDDGWRGRDGEDARERAARRQR